MVALFCESFASMTNTSQQPTKWTVGLSQCGTSYGRNGGSGMNGGTLNSFSSRKDFGTNYTTLIVGFAFKNPNFLAAGIMMAFLDSGTLQFYLQCDGAGHIQAVANSVVLGTGSAYLQSNNWYYVEIKTTFNASTGSCELRVNGSAILTLSGVRTTSTANNFANGVIFGTNAAVANDYADLYIVDTTGAVNNDFLGDVRVQNVMPNGAGNYTQWTQNGGTTNWGDVSEIPPNGDTTYVSSSTPGQRDSYTVAALAANTTSVLAVQVSLNARKDDAGTRQIANLIRNNATDSQGTTVTLTSSYQDYSEIFDTNPSNGNAAWAVSDINSGEFGVIEVA